MQPQLCPIADRPRAKKPGTGWLILALAGALLLAGCAPADSTPQIVFVTETASPTPAVMVVTATYTVAPEQPTAMASATLPAPTDTPVPEATKKPLLLPTKQPLPTATDTPPPAPTDTAVPTATPAATSTSKPVVQQPSLRSYFVVHTAFKGPDLQDYSLWAVNGDGSDPFKIEGAGQASEPEFSVDGNKLAFYHWTDGLYIWDLNRQTSLHFVHDGNASFPTWSPNGQRLAYFVQAGQRWVYVVNTDGSDNHQLTPGLRPNWSRQGGFIAYDTCENNQCGIYRINPDGGGKRQLTSDGGGGPAVRPDGKGIAYYGRADGDFEIYLVNPDGSGRRQLTQNNGNDALPAWSPDGKYIFYLSDQNGKGWAVMVMNADGSNPRKVVNTTAGNDPYRGWQYQRLTVTWNN
jgi:Tol biopolymer transport system component